MACEADSDVTRPDAFRVLVTADYFEPGYRAGGPVRSLSSMLDTVGPGIDTTLVTRDRDLGASRPYLGLSGRWVRRGRCSVFYLGARNPRQWRDLWRGVRARRFDLLYVNSVWSSYSIVSVLAARLGVLRVDRILVAPRGELGAGALALRRNRKRLFLLGWRRLLGGSRVFWHATTPLEAADIRRVFPAAGQPFIAGATGPAADDPPAAPASTGPARLVFIGRVSPMKNLDLVLAALSRVRGPVEFDVYGPIEDTGYWQRCLALMEALPGDVRATYRGALRPEAVRDTFSRYDAFVLPTRGENFGHVIAESLSVACPVICSDRTPWSEVLEAGGGAVLPELTVDALATKIEDIVGGSAQQRHAARVAAGAAYRDWRERTAARVGVLDVARTAFRVRQEASAAR
ncbi:glycosyltransferase [Micromonospora sp. CPCC 205561]|uniref:glycosyltransferase n=1 Tax=Micromonospora sp. CPCC 205561 TaxID=3122407 RepID=UPI002FF071AD